MDSVRVLLVSPNRGSSPELIPPLAAAHLAGSLRAEGIETHLVDFMLEGDPETALRTALRDLNPHLLGLTVRNIDNTSFPKSVSFVPELVRVAQILREHDAPIVVGGAGASISPEALLDRLGLDICVVGEGERVLPRLIEVLLRGEGLSDLPGVVSRTDEGFRFTPRPARSNLAGLPRPDYSILDLAAYRARGGVLGVQTKRGCPFDCTYCVYPALEGGCIRTFSPDVIADEVAELNRLHGVERFFFVDSVFNNPPSHASSVAQALAELPQQVQYGCYVSPKGFSRELAEDLSRSGCEGLEFGTDSLSDPVLRSFQKPFKVEDVYAAADACRRAGVPQCHHLVFGAPGETPETVEETLARIEEIQPDAVIGMTGLRVFAGTPLAKEVMGEGSKPEDLLDPVHYISPAVSAFLTDRLLDHAQNHAGWVLPGLGHNCDVRLFERIRATGFRGPPWILLRRIAL